MSTNNKSQKIVYKNCNHRQPTTIKETKFFGTTNSFDEQSKTLVKCDSPKFFRTQSFGILSPKSQMKFFASVKSKNLKSKERSVSVGDSDEKISSRCGSCLDNGSVGTLAQVREIFDENSDFDVAEVRGLERLKRLRSRYRKGSLSMESNSNATGRSKRYV